MTPLRQRIVFSDQASVGLFEYLVIAGAPAIGLLNEIHLRDRCALKDSLAVLRDMWQRVDSMFVPKEDLEHLHRMEAESLSSSADIPEAILGDNNKLARYYVYLLFRYIMSWNFTNDVAVYTESNASFFQRLTSKPKLKTVSPLRDIPVGWLQATARSSFPSAPPQVTGFDPTSLGAQQYRHTETWHGGVAPSGPQMSSQGYTGIYPTEQLNRCSTAPMYAGYGKVTNDTDGYVSEEESHRKMLKEFSKLRVRD